MIPENIKITSDLKIKRVTTDDYGRQTLHGYTVESNNNIISPGYRVVSFTHPEEREITISEKQLRRRYSVWTKDDDKSISDKSEEPEWITRESSYHCVFCGKLMLACSHKSGHPKTMKCNHCSIEFDCHYPNDSERPAGDSFSLTYWE